jgi:hypothetical protein
MGEVCVEKKRIYSDFRQDYWRNLTFWMLVMTRRYSNMTQKQNDKVSNGKVPNPQHQNKREETPCC